MTRISHTILALAAILSITHQTFPQAVVSSESPVMFVDFEAGIAGVSLGSFDGLGFSPEPLDGQLDSDAWSVIGFSDGNLPFGGSAESGDLARGSIPGGGTSTGGLYALADFPEVGGRSLAIQPGGTDFTPGSITLRIVNEDPEQLITSISIAYDIYELNDAGRSSSFSFSYSIDGVTFTPVPALDHMTTEAASPAPEFVRIGAKPPSRAHQIDFLAIVPGESLFIRWGSDDLSGTGSRDEFALDNISLAAKFLGTTAAVGTITGRAETAYGNPITYAQISLTDSSGLVRRALTNQFGRFLFRELPVGDVYILQASSGKFGFQDPLRTVLLEEEVQQITFIGKEIGPPVK